MKFSFMQNPLTQIQFYAWIYNSFINSHLLEWLKVRQIKSGIRVNFDQCAEFCGTSGKNTGAWNWVSPSKLIRSNCVAF